MAIAIEQIDGPAWIAPYILGDGVPETSEDLAAIQAFLLRVSDEFPGFTITNIEESSERFTWSYHLYSGKPDGIKGGTVATYTLHGSK